MPATPLPTPFVVSKLLGELLERDVTVRQLPAAPSPIDHGVVGQYTLDDGSGVITSVLDVALGASLGASLTRFSPATVESALQAKKLDDALFDNLREVLNVCASLFNGTACPHIVFKEAIPSSTATVIGKKNFPASGKAIHFSVAVPGYKAGNFSFYLYG